MITIPTNAVSQLNDQLRCFGCGGAIVLTPGIQALSEDELFEVMLAVQGFSDFNDDNDPYGEHDCVPMNVKGLRIIWKIDYYDNNLQYHSPDKADPSVTKRVLTVMLASEY